METISKVANLEDFLILFSDSRFIVDKLCAQASRLFFEKANLPFSGSGHWLTCFGSYLTVDSGLCRVNGTNSFEAVFL